MTYHQANLSLQLLAEERIGTVLRANREAAEREQDAADVTLQKAFALS